MTVTVEDHPDAQRYEIHEDGALAGFVDYRLHPDRIALVHTEVDPAFGGRGLAGRLVAGVLDDVRRRGLAVLPFCPYVGKVIAGDPARYLDLVREKDRAGFELPASA